MAHSWFQPLSRRLAALVFCLLWLAFEFWMQEPFWLLLAGAVTLYAVWDFFLSGNYRQGDD